MQVYDLDGDGLEVIDPKIYKAEQEEQYEEEGYENAIPNYMVRRLHSIFSMLSPEIAVQTNP